LRSHVHPLSCSPCPCLSRRSLFTETCSEQLLPAQFCSALLRARSGLRCS
jgi:hypothetical protein